MSREQRAFFGYQLNSVTSYTAISFYSLLFTLYSLLFTLTFAQTPQDLGAKLPLVTVGTSVGWMPTGDEVEFTLAEKAWVKLSIYSPTLDLIEIGDELYNGDLLSTFSFRDAAGLIRQETFQLAATEWVTFYEGVLEPNRYVLRSDVIGKGKNVYLLRLVSSLKR